MSMYQVKRERETEAAGGLKAAAQLTSEWGEQPALSGRAHSWPQGPCMWTRERQELLWCERDQPWFITCFEGRGRPQEPCRADSSRPGKEKGTDAPLSPQKERSPADTWIYPVRSV